MRFPTPMPDRDQAVNSTVARTPCRGSAGRHASPSDTIKHTHLRAPEKLIRTWKYEEIASDGKWRKKELRTKIKNMRCQL